MRVVAACVEANSAQNLFCNGTASLHGDTTATADKAKISIRYSPPLQMIASAVEGVPRFDEPINPKRRELQCRAVFATFFLSTRKFSQKRSALRSIAEA